jgi:universal stress protein E
MTWRHIMFAVASPGGAGPAEMGKVAALATAFDAEVELFHCIHDPGVSHPGRFGSRGPQEDIHEFVVRRREQLERNAGRLRARGVRVRTSVRWDHPAHEGIVRQVLRHKPDLLIAQSARKGRFARLVLTQTDYRLIETCPCPVLFIKTAAPYSSPVILAAVDPGRSHAKPAALDDEILEAGSAIRSALHGKLLVVHAGVPWEDAERSNAALRHVPDAVRDDVRAAYFNRMRTQVAELAQRHHIPADAVRVEETEAAELLPRVTRNESAGLVVLGFASRSRLRGALVGHTVERVLDALDCDVLVVKPPGFRTPVSRGSRDHVPVSAARAGRYVW